MYFLHGTVGAGKSHLLAAITCLLIKEGHKVVYLPDCRSLLKNTFGYLRSALRLTFHKDMERAVFLDNCETLQHLEKFCDAASSELRLLFIVDQAARQNYFRTPQVRKLQRELPACTSRHIPGDR
ncbi:hypothetical protein BGX38DRAFT_1230439 [Terfezia claveryi]|nr:hypothetical protein BGX38DRAFT_1230439 [Terfezia claveryi]